MIAALFENFALQLLYFVGIISVLGLLIWRLNKTLFKLLGYKHGKRVFLSTGIVGVPIHEFGHVFFCVFFAHKIKEVKWFTPNSTDGTLGVVRHTYNKKNIYHQIGNFFIGLGPLLFGSAVIIGLMYLLMPNAGQMSFTGGYFASVWNTFLVIFHLSNFAKLTWWLFIILACSIAMHMDLSWEDVKGSLRGLLYITIIVFVMNLVLCLINTSWARAVTGACLWLSVSVVSFMAIAILLLTVLVLISLISHVIRQKFSRRKRQSLDPSTSSG